MINERKVENCIRRSTNVYESPYLHERECSNIVSLLSEDNKQIFSNYELNTKDDWVRGAILSEALEDAVLNPVSTKKEYDKNRFNSIISEKYSDKSKLKEYEEYYYKEITSKFERK